MRIARLAAAAATLTMAAGAMFTPASAHGNPHFQNVEVEYSQEAGAVTATGSVAGLATHDVVVTLDGDVSADCQNKGKSPRPPKGLHRSVTATGTFSADDNGKANFALSAPIDLICPGKMTPVNVHGSGTLTATVLDDDGNPDAGHEPLVREFSF